MSFDETCNICGDLLSNETAVKTAVGNKIDTNTLEGLSSNVTGKFSSFRVHR